MNLRYVILKLLYEIKQDIRQVKYKGTDNYQIMKGFINNTEGILDILISEE